MDQGDPGAVVSVRPSSGGDDGLLLERAVELSALRSLLAGARVRSGWVGVVAGAAGISKSRLLDAARAEALGAGMLVLRARASALVLDFPFGVVRQLFEPVFGLVDDRERLFAGAAGLARALVDPADLPPVRVEDRCLY